jgi:hypothetical protein
MTKHFLLKHIINKCTTRFYWDKKQICQYEYFNLDRNSFRPISLTNFLLKTMERLMDFRMKERSLKKFPLKPMQHAYLKSKSTKTAPQDIVQKIDGSLAQKYFVLGVFLDVERAFENTTFELMDDAANDHGVCSTINRWIDYMLRSGSVFVDIRGVIVHMIVRRGCLQGSVLSSLLCSMVADSLLNRLKNCNCFVQGFADDVVILISGKFLSSICEIMQRALNCIHNWFGEKGLNFNADKTSMPMALFTKRRKLKSFFCTKLFDTDLILNNQV